MNLDPRLRANLGFMLISVGTGVLGGMLYGASLFTSGAGLAAAEEGLGEYILRGAVHGLIISASCSSADIFFLSNPKMRRIRALPFAAFVGLRGLIYGLGIFIGLRLPVLLFDGFEALDGWTFTDPVFARSFAMSMAIALFVSFAIEISRLLGPGVLPAMLTGRYHRPQREERVFLFADIEGSTALAERIGDLEFHRFMAAVVDDWSAPVMAAKGETYRYVGDEIIVSWPAARGVQDARCLACVFEMRAALATRAEWYRAEFGAVPAFRAALHCGPVVTGEMGDQRKEIVFLGDTVNTAARLQAECRERGEELLLSGRLADMLPPLPGAALTALGDWLPRGKTKTIRLYAARPA